MGDVLLFVGYTAFIWWLASRMLAPQFARQRWWWLYRALGPLTLLGILLGGMLFGRLRLYGVRLPTTQVLRTLISPNAPAPTHGGKSDWATQLAVLLQVVVLIVVALVALVMVVRSLLPSLPGAALPGSSAAPGSVTIQATARMWVCTLTGDAHAPEPWNSSAGWQLATMATLEAGTTQHYRLSSGQVYIRTGHLEALRIMLDTTLAAITGAGPGHVLIRNGQAQSISDADESLPLPTACGGP